MGFSKKKIPAKLDCIVIGSGPGGLTTAALLAKKGWKVLVLEQHDRCGGGLHTYDNKGFEWETGFHYIGEVQDRQSPLNRIIANLTGDSIEWECLQNSKFNESHYDEVWFGQDRYRFPQGPKALSAELKKHFPDDTDAVDEFISRCQRISKLLVPFMIWRSIRPLW